MAIDLNSISKNPTLAPPRVVIYGPHGVGKTTFGAQAPGAVVLPIEDGLGTLEVPHFPRLTSYAEVGEAIGALANDPHDYATVVIDSLDWLEPLIWAETIRRTPQNEKGRDVSNIEDYGYGKGFLFALDVWRELFDGLGVLRRAGMAVIFTGHSEIKQYNDPENDPYDRYQLKLQARAAALVEEWADCVLFANWRTTVKTADAGFNKKVRRGIGSGERLMFTEERPAFRAKNRYSLPAEMPLSWHALQDAITPTTAADDAA